MLAALYCMMLPLRSMAESIILNCSYIEVFTGTNGVVMTYPVRRTIKVDDDGTCVSDTAPAASLKNRF
jgi:hypothetical protein